MAYVITWRSMEGENMITEQMKYSVGALLYSPALNVKIADAIISSKFDKRY